MSMHSRLLDLCKSLDASLGGLVVRFAPGTTNRKMPRRPTDVVLIRLWGLGNLALLAPHLAACRDSTRLRLLTLERNREFVVQHFPWVEVLSLPDPSSLRLPLALFHHARSLAQDPPEVLLDLEQFLRLPLWLFRRVTGAPSIGLDTPMQGRSQLLDKPVRHDATRHVAETFAALWRAAGLNTGVGPGPLRVDPSALPRLPEGWSPSSCRRPLIVVHPGSGDHFPGRRWSPQRFGQLAKRLARSTGARVVLTGLDAEAELIREVLQALGSTASLNLCGQLETRALVALLAEADLLLTNDTGPLHLADALGTRSVALYGPNTPHRYGPRTVGSRAVFADLPCSPCLDDRSMKRSSCRHFACMDALSVDAVESICMESLQGNMLRRVDTASHALAH